MAYKITQEEYEDATYNYEGWCTNCEYFTRDECEPDAAKYRCPDCGHRTVYGAEEALMLGLITIDDGTPVDETAHYCSEG